MSPALTAHASPYGGSVCRSSACGRLAAGCHPRRLRGGEIRRSDAPRLVDLVREAQQSVDRLTAERDALVTTSTPTTADPRAPTPHWRRSPNTARRAWPRRRPGPDAGPGLVVTLNDAQRDAEGRFPRDASPDDLVVHQQDIDAVLNALWSGGAEGIQMQDQRIIGTSAPRCVATRCCSTDGPTARRTWSPRSGTRPRSAALSAAPLVTLYKQYVVRFGLGYTEEPRAEVELVGHTEPMRMRFAKPAGPIGY